MHIIQICLN